MLPAIGIHGPPSRFFRHMPAAALVSLPQNWGTDPPRARIDAGSAWEEGAVTFPDAPFPYPDTKSWIAAPPWRSKVPS